MALTGNIEKDLGLPRGLTGNIADDLRATPARRTPAALSPKAVTEIEKWWIDHPDKEPLDVILRFQGKHKGWNLAALQRAVNDLAETTHIRMLRTHGEGKPTLARSARVLAMAPRAGIASGAARLAETALNIGEKVLPAAAHLVGGRRAGEVTRRVIAPIGKVERGAAAAISQYAAGSMEGAREGATPAAIGAAELVRGVSEEAVPFLVGAGLAGRAEAAVGQTLVKSPLARRLGQYVIDKIGPHGAEVAARAVMQGAVGGPTFSVALGDNDATSIIGTSVLFGALGGLHRFGKISREAWELEAADMRGVLAYADEMAAQLGKGAATGGVRPRPIIPAGAPPKWVEEAGERPVYEGVREHPRAGELSYRKPGPLEKTWAESDAIRGPQPKAADIVSETKPPEAPGEAVAPPEAPTPVAAAERPVEKPTVAAKGVVEAPGVREVAPEVARAEAVRPKELWEMNQAEWDAAHPPVPAANRRYDPNDPSFILMHPSRRTVVKRALEDGLPVPPEVLAEYPDLVKAKPAAKLTPKQQQVLTEMEIAADMKAAALKSKMRPAEASPEAAPKAESTQNVLFPEEKAQAARQYFKGRRGQKAAVGFGPRGKPEGKLSEELRHAVNLGGYHFERGVRTFAKWSAEMVKELGDWVRPHLQAIWGAVAQRQTRHKYAGSINLERLETADDVKQAYLGLTEAYGKEVETYRRGTRTWKQTQAAADEVTFNEKDWQAFKPGEILNSEQTQALRETALGHMERVAQAKETYRADPSPDNFLAMTQAINDAKMPFLVAEGNSTEVGRALNIHKKMAEARRELLGTEKDKAWRKAQQLAGEQGLTPEQTAAFLAIPEGDAQGHYNFLRQLQKINPEDKALYVFVSSILSGPRTHLRNMLWNINRMFTETPVRALRGFVDPLVAKAQGRTRIYYPEEAAAISGELGSIIQGARKGLRVFMEGVSPEEAAKFETVRYEPPGGVKNPLTWPLRALGAEDAAAKVMLAEGKLMENALRQGSSEGLKGRALFERAGELRRVPTIETTRAAQEHADRLAMTGKPDIVLKNLLRARESAPRPIRFALKVIQPFINVPWKLTGQVIEHSPINLLRLLSKEVRQSPEASDVIARGALGSLVIASIAVADRNDWIEVTGAVPRGPAARDEFYRTKKVPYSIRVGGRRVSYRNFGPYSFAFAAVAAAKDVARRDPDADFGDRAIIAALAVGNYMADASFLSGLTNLTDMLRPDATAEEWKRWATRVGQGFLWPSGISRTITQMTDPYIRAPETFYQRLATNVPGLSFGVPARVDVLGRDVKREGGSGLLALLPEQVPSADVEPVDAELARLGIQIGAASNHLRVNDKDVTLDKPQRRDYQKRIGTAMLDATREFIESPTYSSWDDEEKEKELRRAIMAARDEATDVFKSEVLGQSARPVRRVRRRMTR